MEEWRYSPEEAWTAMHAIAKTLKLYLNEYIINQFGYDKNSVFAKDIDLLDQEISAVMEHIDEIQGRL